MDIKLAFCNYFLKLESLYAETFGTKPTVPYSDSLDKEMLLGSPDEEGEIQWLPKEQEKIDWQTVETDLGFSLKKELKDYYNTYLFLAMPGMINNCELHFYRIDGSEPLNRIVIRNYHDAQAVFPNTQTFLIGNANIDDDDSYFIYYDNASGEMFCYESDTENRVLLSSSIAKIIGNMEASL